MIGMKATAVWDQLPRDGATAVDVEATLEPGPPPGGPAGSDGSRALGGPEGSGPAVEVAIVALEAAEARALNMPRALAVNGDGTTTSTGT